MSKLPSPKDFDSFRAMLKGLFSCFLIILILLCFIPVGAASDLNESFVFDGYCLKNEYYSDVLFSGNTVLLLGIPNQIWDLSQAEKPELLSDIVLYDSDRAYTYRSNCVLTDQNIYWLTDNSMYTADISDLKSPKLMGECELQENIYDFIVKENLIYCVNSNSFTVFDITDPFIALKIYEIPLIKNSSYPLTLEGNKLFLLDQSGIRIISIANPREPQLQGIINYESASGRQYKASEDLLALSRNSNIEIWDISDSWNPRFGTTLDDSGDLIALSGESSILVTGDSWSWDGYDLTDPAKPRHIWKKEFADSRWNRGNDRYLARIYPDIEIYEYSKFSRPQIVFPHRLVSNANYTHMVCSPSLIAVSTETSTIIQDADAACNLGIRSILPEPFITGVFTGTSGLILSLGDALKFYDITQPETPVLMGQLNGVRADKLSINTNTLTKWSVDQATRLTFWDVSDFSNPQSLGSVEVPDSIIDFSVDAGMIVSLFYINSQVKLSAYSPVAPFEKLWETEIPLELNSYLSEGQIERANDYWFIRADQNVYAVKANGINLPGPVQLLPDLGGTRFRINGHLILVRKVIGDLLLYSIKQPLKPELCGVVGKNTWLSKNKFEFPGNDIFIIKSESICKYRYLPTPKIEMAGWRCTNLDEGYRLQATAQVQSRAVNRVEVMDGTTRTGILLNDDGINGDMLSGDNVFSLDTFVNDPVEPGAYQIQLSVTDQYGRINYWPKLKVGQ